MSRRDTESCTAPLIRGQIFRHLGIQDLRTFVSLAFNQLRKVRIPPQGGLANITPN